MKTTTYYPVLMVDDVTATAAFYTEHFRFMPLFESDWYVHLQSPEKKASTSGSCRQPRNHPARGQGTRHRNADQLRGRGPDAVHERSTQPAYRS